MFGQFSDSARRAMVNAENAARGLNHTYVGTEHLLLGLIQDETSAMARALHDLGADARQVRHEIERLVAAGNEPPSQRRLPLTPRAKQAIAFAEEDARYLQQDRLGPEHLLFGLMREPDGVAGQVLRKLGLELTSLADRVFAQRLNQLKFVERIVRPVRAGTARKRKMREELLAHLTAVYDEELDRLRDPDAAMRAAAERFGEPAELTRELEIALPRSARREYFVERWFGWRPPETAACWTRRLGLQLFAFLAVVCTLGMIAAVLIAPRQFGQWQDLRGIVAFVVAMPASVALLGLAYFKLRDALFGVFGTRKSWFRVCVLEIAVVLVVVGLGVGYVAFSEWDLIRAKEFVVPYGAAGLATAIAMLVVARRNGPTEIRDALWECLDIDGSTRLGTPPVEPAG